MIWEIIEEFLIEHGWEQVVEEGNPSLAAPSGLGSVGEQSFGTVDQIRDQIVSLEYRVANPIVEQMVGQERELFLRCNYDAGVLLEACREALRRAASTEGK